MKMLKIAVATATLMIGSMAQAAVAYYSSTLAGWSSGGTVTDTDGDTQWTLNSFDAPLSLAVINMSEDHFATADYYTMEFDFAAELGGIQDVTYTVEYTGVQLGDEFFHSAHLDTTHTSQTGAQNVVTVTKQVFDLYTDALLLTLTSTDGAQDDGIYGVTKGIRVVETYAVSPGAVLYTSANTFDVVEVPAPLTPALLGVGLVGLGWSRRRQMADKV